MRPQDVMIMSTSSVTLYKFNLMLVYASKANDAWTNNRLLEKNLASKR